MTSKEYEDKLAQISYLEGICQITPQEASRRRYAALVVRDAFGEI